MNVNINIDDINTIKNHIESLSGNFKENFLRMVEILNQISGNIQSTTINSSITKINDEVSLISSKFNNNFTTLLEFLESQMMKYNELSEEALKDFKEALSFIEANFVGSSAFESIESI